MNPTIPDAKDKRHDCHEEVIRTRKRIHEIETRLKAGGLTLTQEQDLRAELEAKRKNLDKREKAYTKARRIVRKLLENQARLKPAPWQANGHEWSYLTDRAKQLLAIAVVNYDLVCTSIYRTWGTGSFHERKPTHGFDCAGSRMVEFQRDLRYGRIPGFALGDLLELFGPDNAACADNGAPYVMSEGSANENLHDNHVHAFVY